MTVALDPSSLAALRNWRAPFGRAFLGQESPPLGPDPFGPSGKVVVPPLPPPPPVALPSGASVRDMIPSILKEIPSTGMTWGDVRSGDYIYAKDLRFGYEVLFVIYEAEAGAIRGLVVASTDPRNKVGTVETIPEREKPHPIVLSKNMEVTVYRRPEAAPASDWVVPAVVVGGLLTVAVVLAQPWRSI